MECENRIASKGRKMETKRHLSSEDERGMGMKAVVESRTEA